MRKEVFLIILFISSVITTVTGQNGNYVVARAPFSSPEDDEFSPVFFKGGVVFTSNMQGGLFSSYSSVDNKPFFKLFQADTSRGTRWQDSRILTGKINSNLNNGPATFSSNWDTVYFSRNIITEGSAREINSKNNKLGLFYAIFRNGEWTDVKEMRFNDNAWNVTTPYLSPDGKRLFFASDKPDGIGGSDLYYSEWMNGYWNNPVNLGGIVNTGGNEAYPFVTEAGDLFFSSDSLPGQGGKDIFYTRFADTAWIEPVNLGSAVNSRFNDFGFVSDGMIKNGYFSSDRSGSLDIYSFRTITPQFFFCEPEEDNSLCFNFSDDAIIEIDPLSLQFTWDFGDGIKSSGYITEHCYSSPGTYLIRQTITDKKTGKVVMEKAAANLHIEERKTPGISIDLPPLPGKQVNISAHLAYKGYVVDSYHWQIDGKPAGNGSSIQHVFREGDTPLQLLAYLRDEETGSSRQVCVERLIKVYDKPANDSEAKSNMPTMSVSMDMTGKAFHIETLRSATEVILSKGIFVVQVAESETALSVTDQKFGDLASRYLIKSIPSENGYSYIIDEQQDFMWAYASYREAVAAGFGDAMIKTFLPADTAETELWNFRKSYGTSSELFFVNNGTVVSQKGMPVLDRLILLMKRNPRLRIMVAAHTDNTGTSYTNQQLSLRQAQSIVDYLVLNGISRSRLSANGYGGLRPVYPDFPESERLKNRRIEFVKVN